jgi:hypothetical protein
MKGFELSDSKKVRDDLQQSGLKPKPPKPPTGGFFDTIFAKTKNFFDDESDKFS